MTTFELQPITRAADHARWLASYHRHRRDIHLATRRTEVDTALVQRIRSHGIAQDVHITILLRQALGQRLPLVATCATAIDAQLAFVNVMLRVALDRYHVNGFRFMRMHFDRKPEVSVQVAADVGPEITCVIGAHHIPMQLHKDHVGPRWMQGQVVNAMTDLGIGIRNILRSQAAIDRFQVVPPSSVRNAPAAEMAI